MKAAGCYSVHLALCTKLRWAGTGSTEVGLKNDPRMMNNGLSLGILGFQFVELSRIYPCSKPTNERKEGFVVEMHNRRIPILK